MKPKQDRYWAVPQPIRINMQVWGVDDIWVVEAGRDPRHIRLERRRAKKDARRKRRALEATQ